MPDLEPVNNKIPFSLFCFVIGLFSLTAALPVYAQNVLSDDLVTNLSCENLSKGKILQSIDPQRAFAASRHIPIKNWSFSVGLYDLANCWSLSHSQRILFYLGRNDLQESPEALTQSLNMIRKYLPKNQIYNEWHMVPWNLDWFEKMLQGIDSNRNFRNDVQAYQNRRFHDVDNASYLNGNRERSTKENVSSFQTLTQNMSEKRLTSLLLRPALRTQHVVVAKYSITRPTGEIDYFVYDSNYPEKEMTVTYHPKTQHFYAPEIVDYFKISRPQDPIGVFLVDNQDIDPMIDSLFNYYQQTCEALNWAKN
jgi:hypothetical protein